jgi:hypothetical protein
MVDGVETQKVGKAKKGARVEKKVKAKVANDGATRTGNPTVRDGWQGI